ncbi:MAG TPA: hypothetical protein VK567_19480, partial [Bradyrhizobium sp.]|nr:hypothetical protein [Bradyrhizobium sp.]
MVNMIASSTSRPLTGKVAPSDIARASNVRECRHSEQGCFARKAMSNPDKAHRQYPLESSIPHMWNFFASIGE